MNLDSCVFQRFSPFYRNWILAKWEHYSMLSELQIHLSEMIFVTLDLRQAILFSALPAGLVGCANEGHRKETPHPWQEGFAPVRCFLLAFCSCEWHPPTCIHRHFVPVCIPSLIITTPPWGHRYQLIVRSLHSRLTAHISDLRDTTTSTLSQRSEFQLQGSLPLSLYTLRS